MIARLARSRGTRKFLRNRMAVAATGVILAYLLVGLAIWMGALTRSDAKERVLPNLQYGFLQSPSPEQRFDRLNWFVNEHLRKAFDVPGGLAGAENPQLVLDTVTLAERRVADLPPAQLDELWSGLVGAFDELDAVWEEHQPYVFDIQDELAVIKDMRKDKEPQGDIDEELAYLKELREEAAPVERALDEAFQNTEQRLDELMPMPRGWAGLVYGFRTFLGSDTSGRSISVQAFYGIKLAFQIGVVVGFLSVLIGTVLGSAAGFFGGWVDNLVMWLVSVLSSVPYLIWLAVFAYLFLGSKLFDNPAEHPELQLVKLYVAMGFTFWVGTCRVIRGEVMKIKELEYVQAATAIGFGRVYILAKHVVPNTVHLMFINFSLIFIGAIKSEVILSFLGLGVTGQPSWGVMISLGREDVQNFFFWSVLSATALMFGLVLAFNIVSDALQDAFDPKHVG